MLSSPRWTGPPRASSSTATTDRGAARERHRRAATPSSTFLPAGSARPRGARPRSRPRSRAAHTHREAAGQLGDWTARAGGWLADDDTPRPSRPTGFAPSRTFYRMRIDSSSPEMPDSMPPIPQGIAIVVSDDRGAPAPGLGGRQRVVRRALQLRPARLRRVVGVRGPRAPRATPRAGGCSRSTASTPRSACSTRAAPSSATATSGPGRARGVPRPRARPAAAPPRVRALPRPRSTGPSSASTPRTAPARCVSTRRSACASPAPCRALPAARVDPHPVGRTPITCSG